MTLHAISPLVLLIYCYTAHGKWLQARSQALWWQLAHGLGTACWGTAQCVTLPHALWEPQEAIVCMWVCGINRFPVWINSKSHLKEGWPSKGGLGRMLSASRQMMNIQQGRANFSPVFWLKTELPHCLCCWDLQPAQAIRRWNISGRMDVMADALSRSSPEKPISQRLSQLLCGTQLVHIEWVESVVVQNVFH